MNAATEFDIGSRVECTDGPVGHLSRVVLDPVARALTHIVVDTRSRRGVGHIVPINYVAVITDFSSELITRIPQGGSA